MATVRLTMADALIYLLFWFEWKINVKLLLYCLWVLYQLYTISPPIEHLHAVYIYVAYVDVDEIPLVQGHYRN